MNDTRRINYLEKKVYDRLYYDNSLKLWFIGNQDNEKIFCDRKIREAIDKSADYNSSNILFLDRSQKEICYARDTLRLNFLDKAIFNFIYFDSLTNQWIVGDKNSNVPISIDFEFRKCIDKLF